MKAEVREGGGRSDVGEEECQQKDTHWKEKTKKDPEKEIKQ